MPGAVSGQRTALFTKRILQGDCPARGIIRTRFFPDYSCDFRKCVEALDARLIAIENKDDFFKKSSEYENLASDHFLEDEQSSSIQ
jgi:hypothetical protein